MKRMYSGSIYGVYLKETDPEVVEKIVKETGAMTEGVEECVELEVPDNFKPFLVDRIVIETKETESGKWKEMETGTPSLIPRPLVYSNSDRGSERFFVGVKMKGKGAGEREEIKEQLDCFFSRATGLEKDGNYLLHALYQFD